MGDFVSSGDCICCVGASLFLCATLVETMVMGNVTPVLTLLSGTNVLRATNNLSERIILLSTWKSHTIQFISQNVLSVKNSLNLLNLCGNILLVKYIFMFILIGPFVSCLFCFPSYRFLFYFPSYRSIIKSTLFGDFLWQRVQSLYEYFW